MYLGKAVKMGFPEEVIFTQKPNTKQNKIKKQQEMLSEKLI